MRHELIAKDYALYVVRHFASMQTWTKKDIIHEICRKIGEAKEDVVRCKDCLYNENGCCTRSELYDDTRYRPDYFCADGERRCE